MLTKEDNETPHPRRPRHAHGQPAAPLLDAGPALAPSCPSPTARRCACGCSAKTSSPSATPTATSVSFAKPARTAAPRCSSDATRRTACAASTTAGSSTSTGACVDMPSEPAESNFKNKVRVARLPHARVRRHRLDLHGTEGDDARLPRPRHRGHPARTVARPRSSTTYCNWVQAHRGQHRHVAHLLAAPVPRPRRHPGRRHRPARLPDQRQVLVPLVAGPRPAPRGRRHRRTASVRRHPHDAQRPHPRAHDAPTSCPT